MKIFNKLFGSADSSAIATPDRPSRVSEKQPAKRPPSGSGNLSAGPQVPVKMVPTASRGPRKDEVVSSPTQSTSVDSVPWWKALTRLSTGYTVQKNQPTRRKEMRL